MAVFLVGLAAAVEVAAGIDLPKGEFCKAPTRAGDNTCLFFFYLPNVKRNIFYNCSIANLCYDINAIVV